MYKLLTLLFWVAAAACHADSIIDVQRNRTIPVALSFPASSAGCTVDAKCAVVFLSAGYGVPHSDYQFLSTLFTELGYLVVAIGHELPTDPPLSTSGNLFETRAENWIRGADTLKEVRQQLQARYSQYNFEHLTLVGHSNGGDISAWLAREAPSYLSRIITLDHRRVPLPKTQQIKVLSIRASDFAADDGVLPTSEEQTRFGSCVVTIANARHNDMSDAGPAWLKADIEQIIRSWLKGTRCSLAQ